MKENQLRLEDLGWKVKGSNPSAGKDFSLKISVKVYPFHPVLIAHPFHVRDAIFVLSSVFQSGNVKKSLELGPNQKKKLWTHNSKDIWYWKRGKFTKP